MPRRQARRERDRSEAAIGTLQAQRQDLAQTYTTVLSPALKKEQARYRDAQRSVLGRGQRQARQQEGERARVELPTLDAEVSNRQRHQQERTR